MCTFTVTDGNGPVCNADLEDQYLFCAGDETIDIDTDLENLFGDPSFSDCDDIGTPVPSTQASNDCGDLTNSNGMTVATPDPTLFELVNGIYQGIAGTTYEGFEVFKVFNRTWTVTDGSGNVASVPCEQNVLVLRPVFAQGSFMIEPVINLDCEASLDPDDLTDEQVPHYEDPDGNVYRLGQAGCKYAINNSKIWTKRWLPKNHFKNL